MKLAIRFAVAVVCISFMSSGVVLAQDQYTEGGVTRVTLVQILWLREDSRINLRICRNFEANSGKPELEFLEQNGTEIRLGTELSD
jgi:hypothetical protein